MLGSSNDNHPQHLPPAAYLGDHTAWQSHPSEILSVTARTEESHEMKLTFCNEMQGKTLLNSACFQTTTPPSIKMLCLLSSPIQHRGVARRIHRLCVFCNEPDRLVLNLESRKADTLNYIVCKYVCTHKGNTLQFNS